MIAVFLGGAALIIWLLNEYYARRWYQALLLRVQFSQKHIYAGEEGELTELVENRKKLPVPVLEAGFRIPKGLRFTDAENTLESDYIYKRDLFAVLGMERILRRYHLIAEKRGRYSVSQLSIHAPSLFFDNEYYWDRDKDESSEMYVYAARMRVDAILRTVEQIYGDQESARKVYEDPFSFSGIRSYTLQDPMKTINWKASARSGGLMVNTFTSVRSMKTSVCLDMYTDPGQGASAYDMRELAISAAASLCRMLAGRSQDTVLRVNAGEDIRGTVFSEGSAQERLSREERFLTLDPDSLTITAMPEYLAYCAGESQGGSRRAYEKDDLTEIFISANDTADLRRALHLHMGRNGSAVLVVPCRIADAWRQEREGNLYIMHVTEADLIRGPQ